MPRDIGACYAGIVGITVAAEYLPVPVYVHMITVTLLIIYIGSHLSIPTPMDTAAKERMSHRDAYMFPVIGSAFLFSIYLVYKFIPKEYINLVVKLYFLVIGVLVLTANVHNLLIYVLGADTMKPLEKELFRIAIPFSKPSPPPAPAAGTTPTPTTPPSPAAVDDGKYSISLADVLSFIVAAIFGAWWLVYNHWSANNVFGIAFSIQAIESLHLGSYKTGFILMIGLFFYDIFWVFGTDVMVTVAKSLDGPIKLLFPRNMGASPPSLLGLGDIVIPGIFIALLLRFDRVHSKNASKFYFYCNYIGYFIGLSTTVFIMYMFNHAQPALLYLVPAALLFSVIPAVYRGDFKALWSFNEEDHDGDSNKKDT